MKMRRLNSSTKAAFLSSNLGRFPKKWHNPKWWCTTTCNPTECGEWRALIGQQKDYGIIKYINQWGGWLAVKTADSFKPGMPYTCYLKVSTKNGLVFEKKIFIR